MSYNLLSGCVPNSLWDISYLNTRQSPTDLQPTGTPLPVCQELAISGLAERFSTKAAQTVTFTFEDSVTGFAASDVTVTNATKGSVSGSGTTYTLTVTPAAALTQGSRVTVTVAANSVTDSSNIILKRPAAAVMAGGVYDPRDLTATGVGDDPATLNISGHSTDWWYQGDQAGAACTKVNAGTFSASLSSLTPGTSYTYRAYNRAGCAAADQIAVAVTFTTLGIVLTPAALTVTEGSTATYTAKLATRPTGNVKVTIARTSGDTDLTISATDFDQVTTGTQLCFTTTTYNSPQTFTVTAAQDNSDNANGTATITHAATGANYGSVTATLVATEADNEPQLSIAAYTHNSATLTIANHTSAWYYEHTGAAATCSLVVSAGTSTATATNLTANTSYTYEAFSDSNCTSSNKLATATAFTTYTAAPTLTTSAVTAEGATLTIGNYSGPWYHKHTVPAGGSCSAQHPAGTNTAQVGILSPATSYTYKAYTDSDCTTELASAAAFTTLTIGNHTGNWYYQQVLPPGGTCSTQISTTTTNLTKLTPGASHTYRAYRDSTCSTGIATASFATSGIILTPLDLTIAEGSTTTVYRSGTSTNGYTVSLATPPSSGSAKVTITLAGDPDIGVAATDCDTTTRNIDLCFTRSYYDTPQTVVLTAAEDSDNLNGSATITHTATGAGYDNVTAATLAATEADNDPLRTATAITTDSATLTIANTTGAWYYKHATATCSTQVPAWKRTVSVTDLTANTSYTYTAYTDVSCSTAVATAKSFTTLTGAGIALTPTSLNVTEGSTATYTIKLATKPTGTVKVAIARTSGDTDISITGPTDCDLTTTAIDVCFTTTTWNTAQTVILSAAEDNSDNLDGTATITHTATGANYASVTATLTATEADNDPRLAVSRITHNSATLTISNHTADWYHKHTTGTCSTAVSAGTDTATVTNLTAATNYTYTAYSDTCSTALITASQFTTLNTPGLTLTPTQLTVNEGGSATYTIKLASQPNGNVKVTLGKTGDSDITVTAPDCDTSTASVIDLCFTTTTWNTAQTVTVRAREDGDDANGSATITHTATGTCSTVVSAGTDTATVSNLTAATNYTYTAYSDTCSTALITASQFTTLNTPGLTLTPTQLTVNEGGSATYTIKLAAQPNGNVKVTLGKTGDSDITVSAPDCDTSTASVIDLCFTTTTWNTAQTVTVRAREDGDDANGSATITHTAAGSNYNGVSATLTATESDKDGSTLLPPPFLPPPPGALPPPATQPSFEDVVGTVFEDAVSKIRALNITQGCDAGGTLFCPDHPVTRGQMATFLTRALQLPEPAQEQLDQFDDTEDSVHHRAIASIAAAGITLGCEPRRFCPQQPVTRGQMAAFLARGLNL